MKNRILKFRAWDKDEKKMYFFDLRLYMETSEYSQEELCPCHDDVLDRLMQFTGIKDIKGTEIYEGDIIPYKFDNHMIGVVNYGEAAGHTGFYVDWKGGVHNELLRRELAFWASKVEVIGNIYENAELVEGLE